MELANVTYVSFEHKFASDFCIFLPKFTCVVIMEAFCLGKSIIGLSFQVIHDHFGQ